MNSVKFDQTVHRYCQALKYAHVSLSDKLKIIQFLADKIYHKFKLNDERLGIIISTLSQILLDQGPSRTRLSTNQRLAFLSYANPRIVFAVAYNLYQNGIENFLPISGYLQIVRYLICSDLADEDLKMGILNRLVDMFYYQTEPVQMEIADILLISGYARQGERLLNTLRHTTKRERVVYADTQNVHNERINQTVLQASHYLIKQAKNPQHIDLDLIVHELSRIKPEVADIIDKVITRIRDDTARFSWENRTFRLVDVFKALWEFILTQPVQDSLKNRLIEEISAMNNYCSSGHLSRLINVVQGFTTIPELFIKISNYDQIKAVVYHYLNQELSKNPDITDNLTENPKNFLLFVQERINQKLKAWTNEYGTEAIPFTLRALYGYTGQAWTSRGSQVFMNQ